MSTPAIRFPVRTRAPATVLAGALLLCSMTSCSEPSRTSEQAPVSDYVIRGVGFEAEREPDGQRYGTQVKETYALDSRGRLSYSAYFGGVPIEMNHNDSAEWDAGEHRRRVFDAVHTILANSSLRSDTVLLSDESPEPAAGAGAYRLALRRGQADQTRFLGDERSGAFRELHSAFQPLISAFESVTGRPLNLEDLSQ